MRMSASTAGPTYGYATILLLTAPERKKPQTFGAGCGGVLPQGKTNCVVLECLYS